MTENRQKLDGQSVGKLASRLVDYDVKRKAMESELEQIKKDRAVVEEALKDKMAEEGLEQLRARNHTIYFHRNIYAKMLDESPGRRDLLRKLKAHAETRPLVKESVNSNTLSAWVRELPLDEDNMPIIPRRLNGLLGASDKISLRTRKG